MNNPFVPPDFRPEGGLPVIATEAAGPCAACGASALHEHADGFDFELQTCRNHWRVLRCTCGHQQLDPRPAPETLRVIYPLHYYSYNMEKSVSAVALAGKAMLDRAKFRGFLKYLQRPARSYLDIGCGDMKYLSLMHRAGVAKNAVFGLELDEAVAARGRALGFQVFAERAEDATSIPGGAIDIVTMFHVIEHVADPAGVLASVGRWLSPGGLLVIETPNTASLDARLFSRRYWGGYHIPRHWHLFSPGGVSALLDRGGFRVRAIRYQTGHAFWLYSLNHLLRYNSVLPCPWLARLFDPLTSLPMLVLATGLDKLRAALGFRTSAMLIIADRAP